MYKVLTQMAAKISHTTLTVASKAKTFVSRLIVSTLAVVVPLATGLLFIAGIVHNIPTFVGVGLWGWLAWAELTK